MLYLVYCLVEYSRNIWKIFKEQKNKMEKKKNHCPEIKPLFTGYISFPGSPSASSLFKNKKIILYCFLVSWFFTLSRS